MSTRNLRSKIVREFFSKVNNFMSNNYTLIAMAMGVVIVTTCVVLIL